MTIDVLYVLFLNAVPNQQIYLSMVIIVSCKNKIHTFHDTMNEFTNKLLLMEKKVLKLNKLI